MLGGSPSFSEPPHQTASQLTCSRQQALRGRLWRLFLRLDAKKDAGVYDQLVQKALGKTKYGRRVR